MIGKIKIPQLYRKKRVRNALMLYKLIDRLCMKKNFIISYSNELYLRLSHVSELLFFISKVSNLIDF